MNDNRNFILSKWYLDCVAADGTTFIGYAAHLQYGPLTFHASSILIHGPEGKDLSRSSLRGNTLPQIDGSRIQWDPKPFHMRATWIGSIDPVRRQLYKDDPGSITWSCIAPNAKANITVGKTAPITGLGYVELLELSIPPWHLPIEELRWGRFLTDDDSLVWIDWKGDETKTIVLHNGVDAGASTVTDTEITTDRGILLSLAHHDIIREGPIISTALSRIPGISSILPNRDMKMHERKWLSKGKLVVRGSSEVSGWAIHELVRIR